MFVVLGLLSALDACEVRDGRQQNPGPVAGVGVGRLELLCVCRK